MIHVGTTNPSAIAAPVEWVEQVLLGPAATGVATLGVAMVGCAMLAGRLNWRRGASAIAGCFIVFGAPVIAHGLSDLAVYDAVPTAQVDASLAQTSTTPVATGYDPYAGAALVVRPTSKDRMRERLSGPRSTETDSSPQTGLTESAPVR